MRSKPGTFRSPLKWKHPALVFTCSWSDFFIKDADPWRDEAWDVIRNTPHLTYQILTKRPGLVSRRLPADWGDGYPNVWLGTSAEDQHHFETRASAILDVPAVLHFLSAEPLLAPLELEMAPANLKSVRGNNTTFDYFNPLTGHGYKPQSDEQALEQPFRRFGWVIVGGESGHDARPCDQGWIGTVVRQCKESRVPVFVKQLGACTGAAACPDEWVRLPTKHAKGGDPDEWPSDLRVRQIPDVANHLAQQSLL